VSVGQLIRSHSSPRSWFSSRAKSAAHRCSKYADIESNYIFQPIAVESLVKLTGLVALFCLNLAVSFQFSQARTGRPVFICFGHSPFLYSVSMLILLHDSFVKEEEE